jgi:hypothetical protein
MGLMERARGALPVLEARDGDADDVRWALSTAMARWQSGSEADALVWLRRAADAADEAGDPLRAAELRGDAEELTEQMWSGQRVVDHAVDAEREPSSQQALRPASIGTVNDLDIEIELEPEEGAVALDSDVVHSLEQDSLQSVLDGHVIEDAIIDPDALDDDDLLEDQELEFEPAEDELLLEPSRAAHEFDSQPTNELLAVGLESTDDRASTAGSMMRTLERPSTEIGPPPAPGMPGSPTPLSASKRQQPTPTELETRRFEHQDEPRRSMADIESHIREARTSSPELEVEELTREELEALLGASPGDASPISRRSFNDRLSSVDIVSASAEAVIARFDSDPESLGFDLESATGTASAHDNHGASEEEMGSAEAGFAAEILKQSSRPAPRLEEVTRTNPEEAAAGDGERIAQLPEAQLPEAQLPEAQLPEAQLPEAQLPEAQLPKAVGDVEAPGDATVDDIDLGTARGFEDLPEEVQWQLAKSVRVEQLNRGEEVGFFGAALITRGAVDILPAFADDAGAQARHGDVVFTKGSLEEAIELRVEAKIDETRVAVWSAEEIDQVLAACPWVADELRFIADYYLAVCGATLGPLGDRLDNTLRSTVFGRMEVRACEPGQLLATQGKPVDGLYVVGGGRIEVTVDGAEAVLSPGDFLFPSTMLSGQSAPGDARAGGSGALVLYAPRAVARELMMSVPPLLEVLAS